MLVESLAVLALYLSPQVALPPGPVQIEQGACPITETRGCFVGTDPPVIWLSPGTGRFTALHEIGHLFDVRVLNDSDRREFMGVMRLPGPWWRFEEGTVVATEASPGEVFADAYANCAMALHATLSAGRWANYSAVTMPRSDIYHPTRAQYRRVCALIRRAAR